MIIQIDKIPEQGMSFEGSEPAEVLTLEQPTEFRAMGALQYDLHVQVVDEMLIVRGNLSAPVEVPCARCTQKFSTTVGDSGFLRDYPDVLETEEVDVTEDLREAILLSLPHFPLCDEACKGLCAHCGKNLNEGPCGCSDGDKSGAWEGLDSLNL